MAGLDPELLSNLTHDWREVLFPDLSEDDFLDAYAQTTAFAVLAASASGVAMGLDVDPGEYDRLGLLVHHIADRLGAERGVLGKALALLTADREVRTEVGPALEATIAFAAAVDWSALREPGRTDQWMDFYESVLAEYDSDMRKRSGSYYTPKEVVEWMTQFTDQLLDELFGLRDGYADENVTVVDPALGTGGYMLSVLDRIGDRAARGYGPGQALAAMREAAESRVIGFENQACPYAVAQLRVTEALHDPTSARPSATPMVFLTDTLADPNADSGQQMLFMKAITESRERADTIKREIPVKVIIGNPPYRRGAEQTSWAARTLLPDWQPDSRWDVATHAKNLSDLYVYFWRWSAWKVFQNAGIAEPAAEQTGIVSFITPTGWLEGDGFQQMRRWLREWCTHIWVLDLSPEGHHAAINNAGVPPNAPTRSHRHSSPRGRTHRGRTG